MDRKAFNDFVFDLDFSLGELSVCLEDIEDISYLLNYVMQKLENQELDMEAICPNEYKQLKILNKTLKNTFNSFGKSHKEISDCIDKQSKKLVVKETIDENVI